MAVFTTADHPLRARQVCEAMDLAVAPNSINDVHVELKRPAGRGILAETVPGLFTRLGRGRPMAPRPARLSGTGRGIRHLG
ncbi:hypothetical protein ACIQVO_09475 [Streptomyces sp. NPDC101062]